MNAPLGFAVAPTPLGAIGVVWNEHGIARTWLHEGSVDRARARIRREVPAVMEAAPPADVAAALADIAALLDGKPRDLCQPGLDMRSIPEFDRRVYELARTIQPGSTMTYGEIAKALGEEPMRARDVGTALSRNPFAPIVPCHRVVAASGLGGYSAPGGTETKRRLLEIEGAAIVAPPPQAVLFDAI